MTAEDFNGDETDEIIAFYKLPASNPNNVRTRIYMSYALPHEADSLMSGFFGRWDPRGEYYYYEY